MPRIRKESNMGESFGVRLTVAALVSVDELADVWKVNRQEAMRRIVDAGLAASGMAGGSPSGSPLDLAYLAREASRGAAEAVIAAGSGARGAQGAQGAQERRAPDSKPVRGGHRKAPPADPPERRETSRRLTDADVGRWVREDRGSDRHAHKLTRLGGGGTGDTACGKGVNLRYAERLDGPRGGADGAGRYCRKCRAL
jgi:hypothetical protein